MTRDDDELRSALHAATALLDPPAPGFAARVTTGGRRRLRRRRAAISALGVAGALVVTGGALVANGTFDVTPDVQPAGPVDGPCVPADAPGWADMLPPGDLPPGVRLLWPTDSGLDVTEGYARYETGPCGWAGWSFLDVENGVVVREIGFRGPEPLDGRRGSVTYYSETAGSQSAMWAISDDEQIRVDTRGLTLSEVESLVEATTVHDDGRMSVDGWPGLDSFDFVDRGGHGDATQYEWVVAGPESVLSVVTTNASGPWGAVGDEVAEVHGEPAFIGSGGWNSADETGRVEGKKITWSPGDGVVAELIVADGIDPVELAESIEAVPVTDPRVGEALAAWPDPDATLTP